MLKYLLVIIGMVTTSASGETFLTPPLEVSYLASELAFKDFPTAADILTIARNESGFNPKAVNKMSNGIMQVNYGSFDVKSNMQAGVRLLRQYYLSTRSIEAAVMSYNIGIGNYRNKVHLISGLEYLSNFKKRRDDYEQYSGEFSSWISCFICGSYSMLRSNKLRRHSRSYFLAPIWDRGENIHPRW